MFTAYTLPGGNRPVTFALNGDPGASPVYLTSAPWVQSACNSVPKAIAPRFAHVD
jgi:hypothetical protein